MRMKHIKRIGLVFGILLGLILIFGTQLDTESELNKTVQSSCQIKTERYQNRSVFVISPQSDVAKTEQYILYLHGGSYMGAMTSEHWQLYQDLVQDLGCTIIAPDYPLTPKYDYQDVEKMMLPFYEELIAKINPENLVVMGDSAGGGLALAILEKEGEKNITMPKKLILLSPWLDVRLENPQIDEVQKNDPVLKKEILKIAGEIYARKDGIQDSFVNPIDGYLDALPEVTVYTGTYDILNPDAHLFKERMETAGKTIIWKEYDKAVHIWILQREPGKEANHAKEAYQNLVNELKMKEEGENQS